MSPTTDPRVVLSVCLVSVLFLLASCASGPAPPAKGTPAWDWQNAGTTWAEGDLQKTSDNLETIAKSGNEFSERAQPWRLIIVGGAANGNMEVADALEQGGKAAKSGEAQFRRDMNTYRSMAAKQAVQFYQTYMEFKKTAATGNVPLDFSAPKGTAMAVPELARIREGIAADEAQIATIEKKTVQRAVLMFACSAVGAEGDTAKAQQVFAGEAPSVPRDTFVLAMARHFNELADFYGPRKIGQPERAKLFNEAALEAAQSLPESEETKELIAKIEKELKEPGR